MYGISNNSCSISESDFMAEIIARVDEQRFKSCKLLNESPFLYTKMHIKCHHKLSPFDFFFVCHKLCRRKKKQTNQTQFIWLSFWFVIFIFLDIFYIKRNWTKKSIHFISDMIKVIGNFRFDCLTKKKREKKKRIRYEIWKIKGNKIPSKELLTFPLS